MFHEADEQKLVRDASVVCVDIVGYSKMRDGEPASWVKPGDPVQIAAIEALEGEVMSFFRHVKWPPGLTPSFVPTGDGFICAIPAPVDSSGPSKLSLALVFHLFGYFDAWQWKGNAQQVPIRAALHYGGYVERIDATGRANMAGDSINEVRRIIDVSGGGRHVLASGRAMVDLAMSFSKSTSQKEPSSLTPCMKFREFGSSILKTCDCYGVPHTRMAPKPCSVLKSRQLLPKNSKKRAIKAKHGVRLIVYNLWSRDLGRKRRRWGHASMMLIG